MNPIDQVSASFALLNLAVLAEHGKAIVKSAAQMEKSAVGGMGIGGPMWPGMSSPSAQSGAPAPSAPSDGLNPIQRQSRGWTSEDLESGGQSMGDSMGGYAGMGIGGLAGAGGGALLAKLMADEGEDEGETKKRMALAALGLGIPGALAGGWLGNEFGGEAGGAIGKGLGSIGPVNDMLRQQFGVGLGDDVKGAIPSGMDAIGRSAKDFYGNVLEGPLKGISEGASNLYGKLKGMFTEDFPGKAEGMPQYPNLPPISGGR